MKTKKLLVIAFAMLTMASSAQGVLASNGGHSMGEYARGRRSAGNMPAGHFALVAHYADAFLSANSGTGGNRTVYAETLMDAIDDPAKADELTDYYLLDIRKPADYAIGHIAGAVNVPFGDVAKPETLAMLPNDKPILIICYTGHTASVANGVLATLGYNAWTLRFGMTSWKAATSTAVWSPNVKQSITGGNYPVVTPPQP